MVSVLLAYDIIWWTPFVFIGLYLALMFFIRTPHHVCIIVLGDIGRSPRMLYHAMSLAEEGFRVYIVGYKGSEPPQKLKENEAIQLHFLPETPWFINYYPKLFQYFLKTIWQALALLTTLLMMPQMGSYFIQNPPSIPTMAVVYAVSKVRFGKLVIDWHNYGYTILALALGGTHPLVRFAERYEKFCGRLSHYNICVTNAMRRDLAQNWKIGAQTVYDRPPDIFRSINVDEKHDLFTRLARDYPVFANPVETDSSQSYGSTAFTQRISANQVVPLKSRPALLVSSTSWTEDEDFGILLEALEEYDISKGVPDLICVITGKGPQKEFYQKKIEKKNWSKVKFCLPWLTAEDYPLLLASADIGVCLHMSSSGLDLPMKVVDMFGCGLPVCAVNFHCISELVQHSVNGLVFDDSSQLVLQLKSLLPDFTLEESQLAEFRENISAFQKVRWHGQWKLRVLPIFNEIRHGKKESYFSQTRNNLNLNFDSDEDSNKKGKSKRHKSEKTD